MKKLSTIILSCMFGFLALNAEVTYSMNFDKETKSLVRKMYVYKNPAWVSKVVNKDFKELYFVSPKSMFEFYFNPEKWEEANTKDSTELKELIVTDFKTHKVINARGAFYVYGSNKISPAGDDLPAFESYDDAESFAKSNNGKRIFSFKEMKKGLIELLNGDI